MKLKIEKIEVLNSPILTSTYLLTYLQKDYKAWFQNIP